MSLADRPVGPLQRTAGPAAVALPRDAALDLLKLLALLSMLIDHLRHVWLHLVWVYVPGRLAFPFFCLIIAANLMRPQRASLRRASPRRASQQWASPRRAALARYIGWLLLFALLSEWPYRLLVQYPASVNVLPTLALGLLLANGMLQPERVERLLALGALLLALVFHEQLMFGVFGVLLPAAFVQALQRPAWGWLLPAGLSLAANYWPLLYVDALRGQPFALLAIAACFGAPLLGLALLRHPPPFPVPPLRRWAYLFYPGHFLLLYGLREWLQR